MLIVLLVYFFFFKQKTAYEMRISDWSSDVCSSDLLHLDELRCRQRAPELLAVQRILARGLIAGLRRAHASPGDAVASTIAAAEGPFQARDIEHVLIRNLDAVQHDLAGDRCAQGELFLDLRQCQASRSPFDHDAADRPLMRRSEAHTYALQSLI